MRKSIFARLALVFILAAPVLAEANAGMASVVQHRTHRVQHSALRAEVATPVDPFLSVFTTSDGRLAPGRSPIFERGPEDCTKVVCIDTN
jgi:hypothetical protein